jgi:hypothetical protein
MEHAFEDRFVRRPQPADKRFQDAAAGIIAQSDGYTEADEDEEHRFPVPIAIDDQTHK